MENDEESLLYRALSDSLKRTIYSVRKRYKNRLS